MTMYAADCYDLGFICEWQAQGESGPATATALAEHINDVHDTGTTSPALNELISKCIFEVDESLQAGGARRERTTLDRFVDAVTFRSRATTTTKDED